ncbi:MAG: M48 family metallopeptidase [Solirubrobacterales bacterium]|nr:M48 family metallopeptidase [Solirubrobacterales bacterium]
MTTALPEDQRLANLSPKAYEHPADRAATAALQSIPMLDVVVRKLIELGYERALRQQFLAASVRLGEDQLPQTWADWNAVCARLDLPERYDLYLTQYPVTNAAAIGAGKPMVVINSRCIDLLDELEIRTVLGHEAGHILSDHVLYRTALIILIQLTGATRLPMFAGMPLMAVKLALLEWYRAAELSSDRAATLVNRDPLVTCRTLMVLAGGAASRKLDLDAFIRQAGEYEDWSSGWDRLNRLRSELFLTHSYPVRRVKEVTAWVRSGDYDRIAAGEYPTRDQHADARNEAGEAVEFYKERFRKIFNEFGGEKAQERVADAAGKVGDWLKTNRPRNDPE